MSWDIVVFNSSQQIESVESADESLFVPVDFGSLLKKHFPEIKIGENYWAIGGDDYAISCFVDESPKAVLIFQLSGEMALYGMVKASKIYGWQIYDTGNGEMIDLDHPENNGYENFQQYLQQVLSNAKN